MLVIKYLIPVSRVHELLKLLRHISELLTSWLNFNRRKIEIFNGTVYTYKRFQLLIQEITCIKFLNKTLLNLNHKHA